MWSSVVLKGAELALKGKKVDLQLFHCYFNVYMEENTKKSNKDPSEIIGQIMDGISLFDSYGDPEKMYASMCTCFNKILSKKKFYYLVDRLLRNIAANPELSNYVIIPTFKENIIKDFTPEKVKFKRTKLMIFEHLPTLKKSLSVRFNYKDVLFYRMDTSDKLCIADITDTKPLDLTKPIYVYDISPELHLKQKKEFGMRIKDDGKTIRIVRKNRCVVCLTNTRITLKKSSKTS